METELIYDESGLAVGEAGVIGEPRPESEPSDIDLDILDDGVLPTSGIEVRECENPIDRIYFIMDYLAWKDLGHGHLYYRG